ncbi:putative peptidase S10, serine carboxypeptidase, alpha/Beta hydrolase [Helianthus annuus]|nr:putative peptidase S10, serine carboxypeptidase, alpha/Beta hydrolase [Helianthus annuus]
MKWFESHPEFVSNPFYVGGDSYSGIPVPIITHLISDGNEAGNEPYINLKGYILGNPFTFPEQSNYKIRFANGMGLISDELYKVIVPHVSWRVSIRVYKREQHRMSSKS